MTPRYQIIYTHIAVAVVNGKVTAVKLRLEEYSRNWQDDFGNAYNPHTGKRILNLPGELDVSTIRKM